MDKITKYLNKHVVAKTSELQKIAKSRMSIIRLAEAGLIQSPMRGYYCLPKVDPFTASLVIVSKYYKHAVISGISAAKFYGLTDESINKIDVDVLTSFNIQNSFLKVKRIGKNRFIGIKEVTLLKNKIKIYDEERTLVDLRLKYSSAIFYKSLKRYIKKGHVGFDKIKKYDQILSTTVITSIMQELADE